MFAESMILHALTECEAHGKQANQPGKEHSMTVTTEKTHAEQIHSQSQTQSQSQQSGQPSGQQQPRSNFVDPLGRPIYQGTPRFTDQQAGGDLTGDESDARDDNYVETVAGQNARDVSAHASELPSASTELLRSVAVASPVRVTPTPPTSTPVEPDGTEDPGANADDGLVPRNTDGAGSEQH
jgi:hypothetical protein